MAKLTRVYQNLFCGSASTGNVGQFGSLAVGTPTTTTNIATIQNLGAWLQGFTSETVAGNTPALEDFNGIFLVAFYQICYLLEMGIAEYDPSTTYYTNSIVQYNGILYQSIIDNNSGNTPSSSLSAWGSVSANPTGTVIMFAGNTPPTGYLTCNGQAVSRTTYATLYSVIGVAFGAGDGSTTFNVPQMGGNVPAGYKSGDPNFGNLGGQVGEATHLLTINEMPSHTHAIDARSLSNDVAGSFNTNRIGATDTTTNTYSAGGSVAHNNIQPSLTLNFYIKT